MHIVVHQPSASLSPATSQLLPHLPLLLAAASEARPLHLSNPLFVLRVDFLHPSLLPELLLLLQFALLQDLRLRFKLRVHSAAAGCHLWSCRTVRVWGSATTTCRNYDRGKKHQDNRISECEHKNNCFTINRRLKQSLNVSNTFLNTLNKNFYVQSFTLFFNVIL